MRNISSITNCQEQDSGGECFPDSSQSFQTPTDHNGPRATQCHICGSGLCNFAQHYTHYRADHQGMADDVVNDHREIPVA